MKNEKVKKEDQLIIKKFQMLIFMTTLVTIGTSNTVAICSGRQAVVI
jgi:hypothetical protein